MKKRILTVVLAVMLLCSIMSITAFATDNDYTVTIYLQEVYRDEFDEIIDTIPLLEGNPVVIGVGSDNKTLKYAIHKACLDTTKPISSDAWVTGNDIYLQALTVDSILFENDYDITTEGGVSTYSGQAWMFFYGTVTPENTIDYPDGTTNTLGTKVVTGNITITLSFEHTTFSW